VSVASEVDAWAIRTSGLSSSYRDTGQGPRYGDEVLLLPAAIGGLGVVLARASLVETELRSGRLVRLFSRRVAATGSFFIVYPQGSEIFEKIQKFQQWLLEQARPVERESAVGVQLGQDVTHRAPRRLRHRYLATPSSHKPFGSAHLESWRSAQGRRRKFPWRSATDRFSSEASARPVRVSGTLENPRRSTRCWICRRLSSNSAESRATRTRPRTGSLGPNGQ
jgi:hypothetical protein